MIDRLVISTLAIFVSASAAWSESVLEDLVSFETACASKLQSGTFPENAGFKKLNDQIVAAFQERLQPTPPVQSLFVSPSEKFFLLDQGQERVCQLFSFKPVGAELAAAWGQWIMEVNPPLRSNDVFEMVSYGEGDSIRWSGGAFAARPFGSGFFQVAANSRETQNQSLTSVVAYVVPNETPAACELFPEVCS